MPEIKILRGSRIVNQNPIAPMPFQPKNEVKTPPGEQETKEEYKPGVLGRLGLTALQGLEAPADTLSDILEYFGEPRLVKKGAKASEDIMSKYNISQEGLKPQSLLESIGSRAAELGPLSFALGGAPGLLRTAVGALPSGIAKHYEAPELVQNLLQLGTELGTGVIQGRIPTVSSEQQRQYTAAKSLVPSKYKFNSKPINNAIAKVAEKLGTEVDKSIAKPVEDAIEVIKNNIKRGKINPNSSIDLRRSLNQLRNKVPENARHYFDDLRDGINEFFAGYAAENPKFYEHLNEADKLTSIKHMGSKISDFAERIRDFIPYKYKHYVDVFSHVGGTSEKFVKSFAKHPKHYLKVASAAIKEEPVAFLKALNNFKNDAKEYLSEEEYKIFEGKNSKKEPKYKILHGKKI